MKKKQIYYKGFNSDLTCQGFKYEIGKKYTHKGKIELCKCGFHACKKLIDVFLFYPFQLEKTRVCEVKLSGKIVEDENKSVASKIEILRELSREEIWEYTNTGYWNTGYWNTGDRNSGNWNSGDRNTGYWNSGYRNTGNGNTGYWNSGDRNTGYGNSGDRSSGIFCTDKDPFVNCFNKPSRKKWSEIQHPSFYWFSLTSWIDSLRMTEKEKKENPSHEITGGFLKAIPAKEAWANYWRDSDLTEKRKVLNLPNFNAKVFEDCTGIKLSKKEIKEILEGM